MEVPYRQPEFTSPSRSALGVVVMDMDTPVLSAMAEQRFTSIEQEYCEKETLE